VGRFSHPNGDVAPLFIPASPLGLSGDEIYEERIVYLRSGTALVLYSDGVSDALCTPETSGTQALASIVARGRRPAAFRLVRRIRRAVHRSCPVRHDDRSALAVRLLRDRD